MLDLGEEVQAYLKYVEVHNQIDLTGDDHLDSVAAVVAVAAAAAADAVGDVAVAVDVDVDVDDAVDVAGVADAVDAVDAAAAVVVVVVAAVAVAVAVGNKARLAEASSQAEDQECCRWVVLAYNSSPGAAHGDQLGEEPYWPCEAYRFLNGDVS